MIEIKASEQKGIFPTPRFFERTGKYRESIQECTREELIDLNNHMMNWMDEKQGMLQHLNEDLEEMLGYHDPMTK